MLNEANGDFEPEADDWTETYERRVGPGPLVLSGGFAVGRIARRTSDSPRTVAPRLTQIKAVGQSVALTV